jgi:pimeloyl-ACP methyl ester carboxylesterase
MPTALATVDRGHGPAVVFLHGQPGRGNDWAAVADRLAARLRVVVPDRLGYGRTAAPAAGIAANADAVVDLLDRLGLAQVVVAGHSWAGAVALDLAQRHPDRVRALVLVGSVGGPGSVDRSDRILGVPVLGPLLSLMGLGALGVLSSLHGPRVRRLVASRAVPSAPEAVDTVVGNLSLDLARDWRSFVVEQRSLLSELPAIAARIPQVTQPATVIVGETDRVVSPRSQAALAAALPAGTLISLPLVGHLIPQEAPQAVADLVLAAVAGTLWTT